MPKAEQPEIPGRDVGSAIREARAKLGPHGGFRARVLLDMLVLELGRYRDANALTRSVPRSDGQGDEPSA